ncbi:STM4012 family radical SAM protein [Ideonella sp. DXS29W]|uniref:STM4012 family radical SAM protein n=1 Tax=Ideonella lacteola TaxID=2984193 RepID=A0ABU9BXJ0_9BURK
MNARDPMSLASLIATGPYQAYSYSYPHKSAYRPLARPAPLAPLWAAEDRSALFAYLHLPFCTMRCGFCNLFAMAQPGDDLVDRYVDALWRQMAVMDEVLGERRFARLALGGGTPSYLSAAQLARVYEGVQRHLRIEPGSVPSGIEVSPETVTRDRLGVCRDAGVDRISMGVQSFMADEVRSLARPQQNATVTEAIEEIRRSGIATLNLDLIYGIEGQTCDSWLASIDSALRFEPEELYLYPLYVRPRTGLGRIAIRRAGPAKAPTVPPAPQREDTRLSLYTVARERLLAAGYEQVSMRMFRAPHAPADTGPAYCCQSDGMVGLGAGARSYTRALHYSGRYAVEREPTRDIVEAFIGSTAHDLAHAHHGFELTPDERRRRYLIQSLLVRPGLAHEAYARQFGARPLEDWPPLAELITLGLADDEGDHLVLTEQGLAFADVIGPWLASDRVRALSQAVAC